MLQLLSRLRAISAYVSTILYKKTIKGNTITDGTHNMQNGPVAVQTSFPLYCRKQRYSN